MYDVPMFLYVKSVSVWFDLRLSVSFHFFFLCPHICYPHHCRFSDIPFIFYFLPFHLLFLWRFSPCPLFYSCLEGSTVTDLGLGSRPLMVYGSMSFTMFHALYDLDVTTIVA